MKLRRPALLAALLLACSAWAAEPRTGDGRAATATARQVPHTKTKLAAQTASSGPRASASTISDAIQLIQLGEVGEVEVADDKVARDAVEAQLKQKTRVRTIIKTVADLGGDGCKRIEMAFVALDIPVRGAAGEQGLWAAVMQWNVCNGGIPPEPN